MFLAQVLAQLDNDLTRRLVDFTENSTANQQLMLMVLIGIVIGLPSLVFILITLVRYVIRVSNHVHEQNAKVLEVIAQQASAQSRSAETYERTLKAREAIDREYLDALRTLKSTQETSTTHLLRFEESSHRSAEVIAERVGELQRLHAESASQIGTLLHAAQASMEEMRTDLAGLATLARESMTSDEVRFHAYRESNGESLKKLAEIAQTLASLNFSMGSMRSDLAHLKQLRETGETQIVQLNEMHKGVSDGD